MNGLWPYDLELEYVPGTQMYIADALSRKFLVNFTENKSDYNFFIPDLAPNYPSASEEKLMIVRIQEVMGCPMVEMAIHFSFLQDKGRLLRDRALLRQSSRYHYSQGMM